MKKMLENIFSIKNQESRWGKWYKVIKIFGLRISIRNYKEES